MLQYYPPSSPLPLDLMFAALADPARRGMVDRLSHGPASASQLGQPYEMTLSAVVQHLKLLETSGLVASQKVGRVRTFKLQPKALSAVEQWIHDRRAAWEKDLDRLEALLMSEDGL